jgi:hypothetical protein
MMRETLLLHSAYFAVAGVRGVFLGRDFVTITKDEATDWDHAKPALLGAIMEHFPVWPTR